jgi:hypothetical protein
MNKIKIKTLLKIILTLLSILPFVLSILFSVYWLILIGFIIPLNIYLYLLIKLSGEVFNS